MYRGGWANHPDRVFPPVDAILFDLGGTLRRTTKRGEADKRERVRRIQELIGSQDPPAEFTRLLSERYSAYQLHAESTLTEGTEAQLWTDWMLPDWPAVVVGGLAPRLNHLWREATGVREVLPETRDVIRELARRGYRLGIVSNTISTTEIPRAVEAMGISGCIQAIVLSSVFGKRKPDPAILLAAAEALDAAPARCAYVGNRPDRDVVAARRAGCALAITIRDPRIRPAHPDPRADYVIDNLIELLALFPPKAEPQSAQRG